MFEEARPRFEHQGGHQTSGATYDVDGAAASHIQGPELVEKPHVGPQPVGWDAGGSNTGEGSVGNAAIVEQLRSYNKYAIESPSQGDTLPVYEAGKLSSTTSMALNMYKAGKLPARGCITALWYYFNGPEYV